MIDLIRQFEFFTPPDKERQIHIIGCGAVGSNIAIMLTRIGIKRLHLWDFDEVGSHNIPNQAFRHTDIGLLKTQALRNHIFEINPEVQVAIHKQYENQDIQGIVFMCVDNIEVRYNFYIEQELNPFLEFIIDTRIGIEDGQLYLAKWLNNEQKQALIESANFKKEEAAEPVSACGTKIAILPTIQFTATMAVVQFMKFIKKEGTAKTIMLSPFKNYLKIW